MTLKEVSAILSGQNDVAQNCDVIQLKVSQSTAVEQMDHNIAIGCLLEKTPSPLEVHAAPTNDGTNACAFLTVTIADRYTFFFTIKYQFDLYSPTSIKRPPSGL